MSASPAPSGAVSVPVMDTLKAATAEQHRNAEQRRLQRDLVRGALPGDQYAGWLEQMFLLHRGLWEAVAARRADAPALAAVVRDEGLHVRHLRRDLEVLGRDAETVVAVPSTVRALAAIAAADAPGLLGYNYVLEGSMNGNRYIARALSRTASAPATAYLDPYGEQQPAEWQAYRARMGALEFSPAEVERMVAAARDMFDFVGAMSDDVSGGAAAA